MKTKHIVDVFVYIRSKGMPEVISNVAGHINKIAGISKVDIHPKVNQLLAIEYNPQQTSGKAILNAVKQNGCSGFLVGM